LSRQAVESSARVAPDAPVPAAGTPAVRAEAIRKSFGDNVVLDAVDLTVGAGQVLVVIGPSGSGKSTLLRCINLLEPIDSGRIFFEGQEITARGVKVDQVRQRIGIVFQQFNLFPHLKVIDNLTLAARRVGKVPRAEAGLRARDLLKLVGLEDKARQYPHQLSGGQQQRVAIARALVNRPALVLGDEPTGSVDTETSQQLVALMRRLNREENVTFVIVSHDLDLARQADRMVRLKDGRIVSDEALDHSLRGEPVVAG